MRIVMDKTHARDFMELLSYYESAKGVVHCLEMDGDTDAWAEALGDCDVIEERVFALIKEAVNEAMGRGIKKAPDPKVPGGLEFFFFSPGERCANLFQACRVAEDAARLSRSVFATNVMTPEERSKARKAWAERYRLRRRELIDALEFVRVDK